MVIKELKASYEERVSKEGKTYKGLFVYLTDTFSVMVNLSRAEKELLETSILKNGLSSNNSQYT